MIIAIAIATAFYATFLPSRQSTRANGLLQPDGTGDVATSSASRQAEVLGYTVKSTSPSLLRTQPAASTTTNASPAAVAAATTTLERPVDAAGLLALLDDPNARTQALSATAPQQPNAPTAVSSVAAMTTQLPPCDVSQSNLYCVYTIQQGDNLGSIAAKFGLKGNLAEDVAPFDLLINSNKPEILTEDDILQIGQKLRVPIANGVVHTVLSAETLGDIADEYDVASADILGVTVNGMADANTLKIGQELLIPNPKRFAKPAPPPPVVAPSASGGSTPPSSAPGTVKTGPASGSGLVWPVSGPISSYFGPSHPLGIDVDLFSKPNAPIGAAAAGTVTFAGGNACCSYGYYVVVDHGGGLQTLYAHFSSISVSVGQKVSQGQVLGLGGRTGYATGNHLHFEVHVNGNVVNPMAYLP